MKRAIMGIALAVCVLVAAALASGVSAQSGGYDLTWSSVDGGGGSSSGGAYALVGTISQFDAGALSGDSYALDGGFWGGALSLYDIYLPVVLKNS